MAKLKVLCASVCLYFSIFFENSHVSASTDDYYLYETRSRVWDDHDLSIALLGNGVESHKLTKRGVGIAPQPGVPSTGYKNDSVADSNKTTRFADVVATLPKQKTEANATVEASLILPANASKPEIRLSTPPQVPYMFPRNITMTGTEKDLKLLGVNGTGQRKIYPASNSSSTKKSTVISTTHVPPLLLNDIPKNKTGKPNLDDFVDNISISKFTDREFNKTLAQHNITNETVTENYFYYNSSFIKDPAVFDYYWVNLSSFENATTHELLSSAHRRAATVTLSFEFPFYGHLIKNVTMATGGFLYTGDYVHAWLAATQYIAPLMANFDTSLSNDSYVRYIDNGTAFTVLWEKVALKDKANEGEFTFQTTLHKNGDIIFVYQDVPTIIENIRDDQHPVKIGLSDAYIIDSTLFFIRRKTIYEYHRVNFQKEDISSKTVIILKALPTCLDQTDCESCLTKEIPAFKCDWCPGLKRCSNGVDRNRQSWLMKGCDMNKLSDASRCSDPAYNDDNGRRQPTYDVHDPSSSSSSDVTSKNGGSASSSASTASKNGKKGVAGVVESKEPDKMGLSGVMAIMLLVTMVVGMTMWVVYAYKNPHTTSGQMLIRYRPSQWRWKRGEARYTAATIHM